MEAVNGKDSVENYKVGNINVTKLSEVDAKRAEKVSTCNAYATDNPTRPGAIVSLAITANNEAKNKIAAPINSSRRASHLQQIQAN